MPIQGRKIVITVFPSGNYLYLSVHEIQPINTIHLVFSLAYSSSLIHIRTQEFWNVLIKEIDNRFNERHNYKVVATLFLILHLWHSKKIPCAFYSNISFEKTVISINAAKWLHSWQRSKNLVSKNDNAFHLLTGIM